MLRVLGGIVRRCECEERKEIWLYDAGKSGQGRGRAEMVFEVVQQIIEQVERI